jgi:asparagine synthetase B (glutamine-hydrolysing)
MPNGRYKHILRLAMKKLLPSKVLARKKEMVLRPLVLRGFEREDDLVRERLLVNSEKHHWRKFVTPNFLHIFRKDLSKADNQQLFLAMACVHYENWHSFMKALP